MRMRYYCTYFDKNYLLKGLALISSLQTHESEPFRMYVVCLDELTQQVLTRLAIEQVMPIALAEIEAGDAELVGARHNRTLVEYYWTLTPSVIAYFLKGLPSNELITYLDADLFFFSSTATIFSALGEGSVLIHEHRFSPELQYLAKHGTYNVGLLCFRKDGFGLEALGWWRARCIEWCYERVEDGKFGDQLYLEDWLIRFGGVRIFDHDGAGVAPWNQGKYTFSLSGSGSPLVNGVPIVFYHFHAFTFLTPQIVLPAKDLHYPVPAFAVALCVIPYLDCLENMLKLVRGIVPGFNEGLFRDMMLTDRHSFLARHEIADDLRRGGITHAAVDLKNGWEFYLSGQTIISQKAAVTVDGPFHAAKASTTEAITHRSAASHNVSVYPGALPTLSIVTPSYNQAAFLEECIDSVLSQGYPNLEYVIMDGGSTDGSIEIIKKYEKYLTYWQSRPDGGQYQAINEGFRHTSGEIMTWLNSDDKFHPFAFAKAASVFMTNAEVQWLTGRHNHWDTAGRLCWFDDHSQVLSRRKHLNGFFDKPFIQQEGTFWRRSLWQASGGGVATGLELAADLELWMRFFRLTRLYVVDTLLAGFRVHENQKSALHNKRYYAEAQGIIAEELSSFAGTLDALPPMPEPLRIDCRYVATLLHDGGCHHVAPLSAGIAWNNYLADIKREAANLHDTRSFARLPFISQEVELLMLLGERALTAERLVLCKLAAAEKTGADLLQAGEQLLELGKLDEAELKFRQAHAVMPHSTHVHRDLARLYAVRGDQLQALEQYRQAVSAIPCISSVVAETAEFLVQAGMVTLAGQLCQEHLNANPHDSVIAEVLQRIAGHAAAGRS